MSVQGSSVTDREFIRRLFAEILERDVETITDSLDLRDFRLDSLQVLEAVTSIEREYQIGLPDSIFGAAPTVDHFTSILENVLAAKAA